MAKKSGFEFDDKLLEKILAYKGNAIDASKKFFRDNFSPAADINESTFQLNSLDILNKLLKQHGETLIIEDVYSIMTELEYREVNLPGQRLQPVWLLKEKK